MLSISGIGKRKISLDEIASFYEIDEYLELVDVVRNNIDSNKLKPVISGKTNGKSPALFMNYRVMIEKNEEEEEALVKELSYTIDPILSINYYQKHLEQYKKDREYILMLNNFLQKENTKESVPISINERSFQIWKDEKFLSSADKPGKRILKNLGFLIEELNIYETTEPLAYYAHSKLVPQNILILENKDTFYSMRKHLLEGNDTICGMSIGTLIYGGGKKINKAFQDFESYVEPYMKDGKNHIYYFGDLDYEGIRIFESLRRIFKDKFNIDPFFNAYKKMTEKVDLISLRDTKEGQKAMEINCFLKGFEIEIMERMNEILKNRKYIPQECLNREDF